MNSNWNETFEKIFLFLVFIQNQTRAKKAIPKIDKKSDLYQPNNILFNEFCLVNILKDRY